MTQYTDSTDNTNSLSSSTPTNSSESESDDDHSITSTNSTKMKKKFNNVEISLPGGFLDPLPQPLQISDEQGKKIEEEVENSSVCIDCKRKRFHFDQRVCDASKLEALTISELIAYLRREFRPAYFEKVEQILSSRFGRLTEEVRLLQEEANLLKAAAIECSNKIEEGTMSRESVVDDLGCSEKHSLECDRDGILKLDKEATFSDEKEDTQEGNGVKIDFSIGEKNCCGVGKDANFDSNYFEEPCSSPCRGAFMEGTEKIRTTVKDSDMEEMQKERNFSQKKIFEREEGAQGKQEGNNFRLETGCERLEKAERRRESHQHDLNSERGKEIDGAKRNFANVTDKKYFYPLEGESFLEKLGEDLEKIKSKAREFDREEVEKESKFSHRKVTERREEVQDKQKDQQ